MKISGSMVLITGPCGGIGSAIARQLAQRGASLILVDRDGEKLHAFTADLRASEPGSCRWPAIYRNPVYRPPGSGCARTDGTIDILINCADPELRFFADEAPADTTTLFNVNTIAPIALSMQYCRTCCRRKRADRQCRIHFGSIGFPVCRLLGSKFALRAFPKR